VATNGAGTFFVVTNGDIIRPDTSPFSRFQGATAAENQYFVEYIRWASDGSWVAVIIDGERHPDPTAEDGVHIFNPNTGEIRQLYVDAPRTSHPGYQIGGENRQFVGETQTVEWSPQNDALLTRSVVNDEWARGANRGRLMLLALDQPEETQPPSILCDYGNWSADGARIIVSGDCSLAGQPPGVFIGSVDRGFNNFQMILDGAATGLWLQNAVQQPGGAIYALGSDQGKNSPMRLVDGAGRFITGPIGSGPPQSVNWSPDRSAALIVAGGRQYLARTNGQVTDVTDTVGGAALNWVNGALPTNAQPLGGGDQSGIDPNRPPAGFIPSGVLEGARYEAGQQVSVATTTLNVRLEPGLSGGVVTSLTNGAFVRVLAGPANVDGFIWWFVQTADRQTGWVAGEINGFITLQ